MMKPSYYGDKKLEAFRGYCDSIMTTNRACHLARIIHIYSCHFGESFDGMCMSMDSRDVVDLYNKETNHEYHSLNTCRAAVRKYVEWLAKTNTNQEHISNEET